MQQAYDKLVTNRDGHEHFTLEMCWMEWLKTRIWSNSQDYCLSHLFEL